MSWRSKRYADNGAATPNGALCLTCGYSAGDHWGGPENKKCPTAKGASDAHLYPPKPGFPKPERQTPEERLEAWAVPERVENALRGILEIGKRDMSNPKYDGYFREAEAALAAAKEARR